MAINPLSAELDTEQVLVIPELETDMDVIQKLDDEPNDVGGLTAAQLKAEFDQAGNIIKTYINETLLPAVSDTVAEAEVRAKAEAGRVQAETERETAEESRAAAEAARVAAETAREGAEQGRVTAEAQRETAEAARAAAEVARVAAAVNTSPVIGENGNWWRWNIETSSWEDTGVTAATGLADGAVTWPKLAEDARPIRDNMLINSRWDVPANIVNQRGQLEYTTGYGIDGWINSASGTVTIESDGLVLSSGVMLDQRLPKTVFALDGQYTLSILTADGKLGTITKPVGENEWGALQTGINGVFARMTKTGNDYYDVASISASSACKLVAAYLEWGDHQTAFRKDANGNWVLNGPPQDFGLELLKCQRYFQTFATQSLRPTKGADFRPVMRTENPTLGTITLPDGTVLYTASSEL